MDETDNKDTEVSGDLEKDDLIHVYTKRWFILFLFTSYSFLNAYQWIHLNIISDKVLTFWNNSLPIDDLKKEQTINWLSMVYMIAYIPLIIPAMWFLKHKGLRSTSLIASFLNALGAWIKCAAVSADGTRFIVLFAGQSICAVAQVFILGIPAYLAAVWFGANEVSTATSLGVFGNQLGIGFGFVIPPLIFANINSNDTFELTSIYQTRFNIMFYSGAAIMTVLFILIFFAFDNKPPKPPSRGQVAIVETYSEFDYKTSFKMLFTDLNFISLFFSYGINTGIFYSISTILNNILTFYFKDNQSLIGVAGLVMIVSGIVSSVIIGVILDKTKAFKPCVVIVYILSGLSMASFTGGLFLHSWAVVFVTMALLGFFMTGYLPLGFELAAEMTYPINEGLTSGLLNLSAQVFGITLTYVGSTILYKSTPLFANVSFIVGLVFGTILTVLMRIDFKRQRAHCKGSERTSLSVNSKNKIDAVN